MSREKALKCIIDELSILQVIIENENKLNLTDNNIFLEDIMAQILNIIFGYSFRNTNFNICNYPYIDLIEEDENLAVQITTNIKHEKIQNTLDNFFKNKYDQNIKTIKFIVFAKTSYRKDFNIKTGFNFNKETDIITFQQLILMISNLDDTKLNMLYDYINTSLIDNIYTTYWMIENTEKSLNNLGKRYNKRLNVFNKEEEKLKTFYIETYMKNKVLEILLDLIIIIENKGIYTNTETDFNAIKLNFSFIAVKEMLSKLDKYKEDVLEKEEEYKKRIDFEDSYIEKIKSIQSIITMYSNKSLIYVGEAGIGKSHSLANFIYEHYLSKDSPALLLLGQDFATSENIEIQISKMLGIKNSLKTACKYINDIAISRNINIPIIIDGINESNDKTIWKKGLINFIKTITSFSNLKLILSIRDSYYKNCISKEIEEIESITISKHNGFGDNSFDAAKEFFEFYNIPMPITQLINKEFDNSLFLTIYCEIVSKYNIDLNMFEYNNFVSIYDEYLKNVNDIVIDTYEIQTQRNIVKESLNSIIQYCIKNHNYIDYENALTSLKDLAEQYDINKKDLLNELIHNGIIYKEIVNGLEILTFTYERYEKISRAQYLLNSINSNLELIDSVNNGNLHKYFDISNDFDNGVLEELLIIIPMKYGIDIFSEIDLDKISYDYYLKKAYIKSLVWIKSYYDTNILVNNIRRLLLEEDYENDIIDIFIKMSYISNNPLNVNITHNHFKNFNMPQIDYKWSIIIENYYDYYDKSTINNIINYCIKYGSEFLNNETTLLVSILLSWLMSSTNRELRDKCTKALAQILVNKHQISNELISRFNEIKDLYIIERVITAIYGSIIRSINNEYIEELANNLYFFIYKGRNTLDNIVVKIYAKKLFNYLKTNFGITLYDTIEMERKSAWYKELPTNEEIDENYSFTTEEFSEDKRRYATYSIIHSMVTEYGRGTSAYGDFGRYTLQPMLKPFEYNFKDIQLLANIATKRVFEYGYDIKLFGVYDNNVGYGSTRHENYIERIGKKYQWIATFELLSKLYDNFIPHYDFYSNNIINFEKRKYFNEKHEETKKISEIEYVYYNLEEEYPHVLYVDSTNFVLDQNDSKTYIDEDKFNFETEENYKEHFIKNINGEKYISLFKVYSEENRSISSNVSNRKAYTIAYTGFIYEDKEKLKESDFHTFSQGTYIEFYNIGLFEFSYSNKYLLEYENRIDSFDMSKNYKICYQEYIWEKYQDDSINATIKFLLPAKWIIDDFNLIQKSEGMWYKGNDLICLDNIINNQPSEFLIRYDYFTEYLKKKNLKLGWTIYLQKSINKSYRSWRSDVFANETLEEYEIENYDKEEWNAKFI